MLIERYLRTPVQLRGAGQTCRWLLKSKRFSAQEESAMRKFITLRTDNGHRVFVALDGWGAGMDRRHRRWTRETAGWRCVDSGEYAHKAGLIFRRTIKPLGLSHR
jgi:hypothetical protein